MKVTNNGAGAVTIMLGGTKYEWVSHETKTLANDLQNELFAELDRVGLSGSFGIKFDDNALVANAISGTFVTADIPAKTITVVNGQITQIV